MHDVAEQQKLQCLIESFRCYSPHLTPGLHDTTFVGGNG
jgi:hypothetical protein